MATQKWISDPTHSELQFKVKHLMISKITGSFTDFTVQAETQDDDFQSAQITAKVQLDSVVTGQADRDKHLKSGDFFDTEANPTMDFTSSKIVKTGDEDYELDGALTIKGVTKPVSLKLEYGGTAVDPWGNTKAAFSIDGKISRKDWGLTYNAPLEAGGVMISDEVKILGEIQLIKSAE
ncbi:YceI family protein [Arachidicoccus ginsenosidivorans]|jgi:polyisoprenoid-binding protein YceI|uniref:YceI family protein n=1 Tax=Arachidicoccus ginsenosidivorans TaxID=496057 RepID=A0A5B8VJJ0_9BACT|nr:YceI family protein [Arachidicoccus ginsenosidivorans]QEC70478.1 YceI family protein [Arachidicoccus ginsenosidivorans]